MRELRTAAAKGISRRVVIVKPCGGVFEQAIFILNSDCVCDSDEEREQVLRQAELAAAAYISSALPKRGGWTAGLCGLLEKLDIRRRVF